MAAAVRQEAELLLEQVDHRCALSWEDFSVAWWRGPPGRARRPRQGRRAHHRPTSSPWRASPPSTGWSGSPTAEGTGSHSRQKRRARPHDAGVGVYELHLRSFMIYNVLITYPMARRLRTGIAFAVLFTVAMGLHFVLRDRGLEEHYPQRFRRSGRALLAGALLVGWLLSALFALEQHAAGRAARRVGPTQRLQRRDPLRPQVQLRLVPRRPRPLRRPARHRHSSERVTAQQHGPRRRLPTARQVSSRKPKGLPGLRHGASAGNGT
jgi:hypothetical protein